MRDFLFHQIQNKFLLVPFLMAFGAALYFMMPGEPMITHPRFSVYRVCNYFIIWQNKFIITWRSIIFIRIFICRFLYADNRHNPNIKI